MILNKFLKFSNNDINIMTVYFSSKKWCVKQNNMLLCYIKSNNRYYFDRCSQMVPHIF